MALDWLNHDAADSSSDSSPSPTPSPTPTPSLLSTTMSVLSDSSSSLPASRPASLSSWSLFSLLEPSFLSSVRMAYVFGNLGNEALFLTDDDDVYSLGSNGAGCLGQGHLLSTLQPKKVDELCQKNVVRLAAGSGPHVIACTNNGDMYTWGHNGYCQLGSGSGSPNQVSSPTLIQPTKEMAGKRVTQVSCGSHHCVCVTDSGDVFAWGQNTCGQLGAGTSTNLNSPRKVSLLLPGRKCVSVSCCQTSTLVALDSGEVYGWGFNGNGQLGIGNTINQLSPIRVFGALQSTVIVKVICGYGHTLALSDDGVLFAWGANSYGQLGTGNKTNSNVPVKIAANLGRIVDMAASHYCHTSACLTHDGSAYMWGQCHGQSVVSPTRTPFVSLHDVFARFASPSVTHEPMRTRLTLGPSVPESLREAFNDVATADLTVVVDDKEMHVHRSLLKIRCQHFRSMFQAHWNEADQDRIEINTFSYPVYRAFLNYLYTDEVNLDAEDALGLLELANSYCEEDLKMRCEIILMQNILAENACLLFAAARRFGAKNLLDFCIKFSLNHMTAVAQTQAFSNLDHDDMKTFVASAARAGAFKT